MEFMIYEKKDTTALITINRPKALNAFNSQMLDELTEALEMAEKDTGVRCVILTAAGERAFTAGGDIKEEVQLNETTDDPVNFKSQSSGDLRGPRLCSRWWNGDDPGGRYHCGSHGREDRNPDDQARWDSGMGQYSPSSENGRRFQSQGAFIYGAQPLCGGSAEAWCCGRCR